MKRYNAHFVIAAFLLTCLVKVNAVVGQDSGKVNNKPEHKNVYAKADDYSNKLSGKSKKYTSGSGTGNTVTVTPEIVVDHPENIVRSSTLGNEIGRERLILNISQKRLSAKTNLSFTLRHTGNYKLEILNSNGAIVTVLAEGNGKAGESFEYQFKKGNHPVATYIGRLITEHEVTSARFEIK